MTDRATLLALAERVEMAVGPDHQLDREIHVAIGFELPQETMCFSHGTAITIGDRVRPYTASLDAALTLVPAWHRWAIKQKEEFYADCWREVDGVGPSVIGATPALALTSAALRARAAGIHAPEQDQSLSGQDRAAMVEGE